MKKALLKDSIKEIKNTYKRFISILLMAFLGVGFFAGLRASAPDMLDTIDQYYKEQQVYDIQIISTLGLTNQDIEEISKVENVEKVCGSYETDGKIEIDNKEIITKLITTEEMNKPVLLEGELPKNADECVVEESFLTANNKKIGDIIEVEVEETTKDNGDKVTYLKNSQMKIAGTVRSPLYVSRDRGTSKLGAGKINYYIYISNDNINSSDIYTNIYVKVKNAEKYQTSTEKYEDYIEEVKDNIEQIKEQRENARKEQLIEIANNKIADAELELNTQKQDAETKIKEAEKELLDAKEKVNEIENPKWYILDRNSNTGYVGLIQATRSIENISKVFPIVFFAVAALISLTSMTRMVEEQRTQIGTLKALGYSKIQIMSKYILYATLASVIGGVLGMCVGFTTLPPIIWFLYMMMYQVTPNIIISFNVKYGAIGLILIGICIVGATIYSAMRELKETPAALMRPKAPKAGNRVLLEKITFIWKRLNFSQKVTLRNIFRYKKRFLMTIIGIFGCTSLIVTGFGIKDSIKVILPNQFEKVFDYDIQINIKDTLSVEEQQNLITELQNKNEIQKIVETYMTSAMAINEDNEEEIQIIVPKDEFDGLINVIDLKTKENIKLNDNEICLTDKVAQLLGVKSGDMITLKDSDNKEFEVKISNIVENYVSHYAYMSKTMYEKIYGDTYKTNVLLIQNIELNKEDEDKLITELMDKTGIASLSRVSTMMDTLDDTIKSLDYVVIILIVSAGLLAFVVLYNLSNVNISERIRELATIKVLGFYDKEVYNYVARETILLTIIGIALGLVGGYFLNYYLIGTCEINTLRFSKIVNLISYVYAIAIAAVFTMIVNIATYFALKKIDMIESLKSVE